MVEELNIEYSESKYDSLGQYIADLFDQLEGLSGQEAEWITQEIRYNELLQLNLVGEVLRYVTVSDTVEYNLWLERGHSKVETISTIYHLWNQASFDEIKQMMVSDTSSDGAVFYNVLDWLDDISVDQEELYQLNDALIDSLVDFAHTSFGDYTNVLRSFLLAEYDIFIPWPERISEPESSAQLTSMETVKENNISLVPNPTDACFKIVSLGPGIHLYHIIVTTMDGRVMLNSSIENERTICLESASPGLYIVKITDTLDGSINAAKLIIQ